MRNTINTSGPSMEKRPGIDSKLQSSLTFSQDGNTEPHKKIENLISFTPDQYPFLNMIKSPISAYKTSLSLHLTSQHLHRLTHLPHFNIIAIKKIVKSNPKGKMKNLSPNQIYSFFYEVVPFALRGIFNSFRNRKILDLVVQKNFVKIINELTDFLIERQIFYILKLEDIGINQNGDIKVFISPSTICSNIQNVSRKAIDISVQKIIGWWETSARAYKMAMAQRQQPNISQLIPPKLINQLEIDDSFDNIPLKSNKSSFIEEEATQVVDLKDKQFKKIENGLKKSNNSYKSELSRIESLQMEKIRRIDLQVKEIRRKLNEKSSKRHKQSENIIEQKKQQLKQKNKDINIFESERILKQDLKPEIAFYPRDHIQQNINCINIYSQKNLIDPSYQNPPSFTNGQFNNSLSQNYISIPSYGHNTFSPHDRRLKWTEPNNIDDPEIFRDQDEEDSQDTYDIQFDNQHDLIPSRNENVFRHTLVPFEKDASHYSTTRQVKQQFIEEKQNQVINKNCTQSAGPTQFKNFITKFIKPQFLAKKSNIYEDPGEYESENSKSIGKREIIQHRQLRDIGKSVLSGKTQSNDKKSSLDHYGRSQLQINRLISQSGARNSEDQKRQFISPTINKVEHTEKISKEHYKQQIKRNSSQNDISPINPYTNQKSAILLLGKINRQSSEIEEKVKMAVWKTRNAIQLLRKVKSSKGPYG